LATRANAHGSQRSDGFRSGFEKKLADQLSAAGVEYGYETLKLDYIKPARKTSYRPDFVLNNGIIIEAKGLFSSSDRQKLIQVKEQHPNKDIRIVFATPHKRISKQSKTTYAAWAEYKGFPWADRVIPKEWLRE